MIETHAHLDFPQYNDDRGAVIERAICSGIGAIINVASSLKGSFSSAELAKKYDCVYAACGIHPHNAKDADDNAMEKLKNLALSRKKIIAIGEVGLDFYRDLSPKDIQLDAFTRFVKLSKELKLPLILHCREASPLEREASELIFKIMEENLKRPFIGVMHCFSGNEELLNRCLDSGLYISYTCNITYKNADNLREVVKKTPMDRLLLETDSPFLSPQAKRGERNEPSNLKYLVKEIAEIRNIEEKEVELQTTQNAKKLFLIKNCS
jgi:TatD DNase family protein